MNKLYKKILDIQQIPKFVKISVIIMINWTFQSLLYMGKTEKLFKIMLDLVLIILLVLLLNEFCSLNTAIILSIIFAHTLNWILNGHFFALLKTFDIIQTDYETFRKYLVCLKDRSKKEESIDIVATFGSLSRDEIRKTSDLDIRIVRKPGFMMGLRACFFVLKERSSAFINGFPLDIYVLDDLKGLNELDERPIIIFQNDSYTDM